MCDTKILIVDDEPRGVELMQRVLRPLGEVFGASSTAEARRILEQHTLSLVISDQRMPHESGVELLAEIAEKEPTTGRILVTGYSDLDTTIEAINRGRIHAYLSKPCAPTQIRLTAESVLERVRLARHNETLIRDLAEHNRRLTHAARLLRESQRNTEDDSRSKSSFLKNVSAELCTPLASILGFTHELRDTEIDEKDRDTAVNGIMSCGSNLLARLHDIREIAAVESGEKHVEVSDFPLAALIEEVREQIAARAAEAKIGLEFEQDPSLDRIQSDALRLKQLMFYLSEHVLRTTHSDTVRVRLLASAAQPGELEIIVEESGLEGNRSSQNRDTSAGSDTQSSFAADMAGAASARGNLALFIGQRLSELLGGRLEIGDPDDPRIHARAILPISTDHAARLPATSILPSPRLQPSLLDARVLILSRNRIEQRILTSVLQNAGACTDIAIDEDAAVTLVSAAVSSQQAYTVVMCDMAAVWSLDDLRVRLAEQDYSGPLIALTPGSKASEDATDASSRITSAEGVLCRPIDRSALLQLVARLADARSRVMPSCLGSRHRFPWEM